MGEAAPLRPVTPAPGATAGRGGATDAARDRPASVALLLALVAGISLLDWATPLGIVVGALLTIPIFLASALTSRRAVLLVAAAAVVGFAVAAVLGRPGTVPPSFWLPNRVIVVLSLPASAGLALLLQRRRLQAERLRDAAVAASETNRLLTSLLAHDLRAPLVVARQCIDYVEEALAKGRSPDTQLLAETRARLDRSARAIDIVLAVARVDLAEAPDHGRMAPVRVGDEIRAEAELFAGEAAVRGKRIELRLDGVAGAEPVLNAVVLRRALSILLDNALRYAAPGVVAVSAQLRDSALRVAVEDPGPAPDARQARGAGLGLDLAGALLAHAGGSVQREASSPGSCWVLTLPVARGS